MSKVCEVEFQAEEISGEVHLVAAVDGTDLDAEMDLEVRVPLVDATPLLQRASERVRGGTAEHATDDSYYVSNPSCLQEFISAFEQGTVRTETVVIAGQTFPASPEGSYMSFNDFSLTWGGRFDIAGGWAGSHSYHREGQGLDVNSAGGIIDIATGNSLRAGQRESIKNDVQRACKAVTSCPGAHIVDERFIHCELGSEP